MKRKITVLFSMLFVLCATQSFAQYKTLNFEAPPTGLSFNWIMDSNGSNPPLIFTSNPVTTGGINTSSTVVQFDALLAGNPWALTYTDDIDPFQFDATNITIKIMVYKPVISNVAIKFEGGSTPIEITMANTVINQWEELTFDFTGSIGNSYSRLVVIPDFDFSRAQDNIIYLDNIQIPVGNIAPPPPPPLVISPIVAAPTPIQNPAMNNVISIFSDAYTDVAGTDFNPNWGQSTSVSVDSIASNPALKYMNLNYQGTQFANQDVSGHEFIHVDFWTDNSTDLRFFLISPGLETEYLLPITPGQWVSVDIPLTAFSSVVDLADVFQFKVVGNGTIWFDNFYFWSTSGYTPPAPPATAPVAGASTPMHDEVTNNVISIFSDAYTDAAATDFNPNWGQGTVVSFDTVGSNPSLKYANLNYQGTVFGSSQDVSALEYVHVDFWTSNATDLRLFLVSPPGLEIQTALPITIGQWVSVDIPLTDFGFGMDLADVIQFKIEGNGTIWFDNLYFWATSGYTPPIPPATAPVAGAPTPTHDEVANGVISIFSDAYTDVAATDFNPNWGQGTVVSFDTVASNPSLKYTSLNYQGTQFTNQDVSALEFLHVDFWTSNSTDLSIYLISPGLEIEYVLPIATAQWVSIDIPLTAFSGTVNLADVFQFKIEGNGTIWFDNLYFWAQPSLPTSCSVLWKGILKASVTGTTFTKTNTKVIWNAGAYSADTLLAGVDGYAEMEILETNTTRIFGLAEPNGNPNNLSIDYGISLNSSGARIVESGNLQSNLGAYASGDIFRVGRVGTTISYYHNGNLVYTSSAASTTPLVVDISILTSGGTIHNASASFGCDLDCSIFAISLDEVSDETCIGTNNAAVTVTSSIAGATYEWLDDAAEISNTRSDLAPGVYTVIAHLSSPMCTDTLSVTITAATAACLDSCLIVWTDLTNSIVEKDGVRLKKTTAAPGWDAGAISENYLASGTDGWIQMGIKRLNKLRVFGLASYNTTTAFEDIDYGFQMRSRKTFRVVENGLVKASFGTFTTTDIFRIERNGTTITYLYNGAVVYTSTVPSTGDLYADASLFKQKAAIVRAYSSFGCTEPVVVLAPRMGQPNISIAADNAIIEQDGSVFNEVTVYPNPFSDQVTINYTTETENVNSIELYNISGQHLRSITISEDGQTIIDTSGLTGGLYIISINGVKHIKIVKM
jgi:hypothetical protein